MARDRDALAEALLTRFLAAGAQRVDPPVLQSADTLLDLYGEDIRARAFVTHDAGEELMLRPDFTVPVVQAHMKNGASPARYAYCGPIWRRQAAGAERAREYLQVGFELFDAGDEAAADAEVFALLHEAVAGLGLSVATGDLSLVIAALEGLETTDARKAALRRHLWRPDRFTRLLQLFSDSAPRKPALTGLSPDALQSMIAEAGPALGKRSVEEVLSRIARLAEDAETPPLDPADVARINALLSVKGPAQEALATFRGLARGVEHLEQAVARFETRLKALKAAGIEADALPYEGSFGRTTLEYYDGFVFGFYAPDREDLPMIASGGRYNALTAALGGGAGLPAVGGIIRPEAIVALDGGEDA